MLYYVHVVFTLKKVANSLNVRFSTDETKRQLRKYITKCYEGMMDVDIEDEELEQVITNLGDLLKISRKLRMRRAQRRKIEDYCRYNH